MQDNQPVRSMFVVPYRILNLPGLTLAFLRFYETIFQFWNSEGKAPCFLSNRKIKERTGISSISTIQEAFGFFESHGEMERRVINGRRYIVQQERKIEIIEQKDEQDPIALPISPYRSTDTPPIARAIHKKANIKKANIKKEKDKRYCEADASHSKIKQSRFEDFWKEYPKPRRILKWKAEDVWINKKLENIADLIIMDVKNRVMNDVQWEEMRFIPHPFRYLRDKRWEDEITLRRTIPQKESHHELMKRTFIKGIIKERNSFND